MFSGFGNRIKFESLDDLNNKLSDVNISVINDTILERERYSIVNYLSTLANHNFFSYPMEVENIDSGQGVSVPDFKINVNGYEYYLELTIASTKEFMDQREEFRDVDKLEFNFSIDGEKVTVQTMEVKDKLNGRPIFGDMPEMMCGRIISETILIKTKKMSNYNIDASLDAELLIYYLFPLQVGLDWNKAIEYADSYLEEKKYCEMIKFDRIHVMNDSRLIYQILNIRGIELGIKSYKRRKPILGQGLLN